VAGLLVAVRHLCLSTPELGKDEWAAVQERVRQDLQALLPVLEEQRGLHGTAVPVPAGVLGPLHQGLRALRLALSA
jgi:hypothetical protein